MRYRRETGSGDYTFGHANADFYIDEPGAVGQAVKTRPRLFLGEYFVDTSLGMPWQTQVFGYTRKDSYDAAVRLCISETQGFLAFVSYSSVLDSTQRILHIRSTITTIYSNQPISLSVPVLLGYGVGGYNTRPYGD